MTVVGDYRDGLLVIASQNSENRISTVRLKCNPIANPELKHGFVGMYLTHESEALHDAMVQIDEFGFGQMIYVDAVHGCLRGLYVQNRSSETGGNCGTQNLQCSPGADQEPSFF